MSHELIRWINFLGAFALVWLWLAWAITRINALASRAVAFLALPIFSVVSYGNWKALHNHLEWNPAANWMCAALMALDVVLLYILITRT